MTPFTRLAQGRGRAATRAALVVALIGLVVASLPPLARSEEPSLVLVRVKVDSRQQGLAVADAFDETHVYDPGYVHALLWPGDHARLGALGYSYEILVNDVAERDRSAFAEAQRKASPVKMPGPDRDSYRVLDDYEAEMRALADKHPSLVRLIELPHESHEGRNVFAIEIARGVKKPDGRPTFYIDGVHHAREWPAGEYPMVFAHYLLERMGKDPDATRLLTKGRVLIVPVVNPDGFDYSRSSPLGAQASVDAAHGSACGAAHCEAYWRKNRRSYTDITLPEVRKNPDAYGVDLNRNYSYRWGGGGSTNSTLPIGDQTNRGPAPQSEPETQNVEELILSRNVTSIITNHTYSRLVLRPWGDRQEDSPDEGYLKKLGARMAEAMGGYRNIKGIALYITTGTMSDWGYGTLGVPSYTFEHGLAFHPPYTGCSSDCVGKEWTGVMKAFMIAGDAALDERAHGVITGRVVDSSGRPRSATLTVARKIKNPLSPGNPVGSKHHYSKLEVSIPVEGSFEWHLPPSTPPYLRAEGKSERYKLTIEAKGAGKRNLLIVLRRGQTLRIGDIRL
jgi:hypothetical protein